MASTIVSKGLLQIRQKYLSCFCQTVTFFPNNPESGTKMKTRSYNLIWFFWKPIFWKEISYTIGIKLLISFSQIGKNFSFDPLFSFEHWTPPHLPSRDSSPFMITQFIASSPLKYLKILELWQHYRCWPYRTIIFSIPILITLTFTSLKILIASSSIIKRARRPNEIISDLL